MAELVAAQCGDWDRLAETWDLQRYAAMQRHWKRVAPPAHLSMAVFVGFKPDESGDDATVDDDDFEAFMREMERS